MTRFLLGCVGLGVIWGLYLTIFVGSLINGVGLMLSDLTVFGVVLVVSLPFTMLMRYGWKAKRNQEKVGEYEVSNIGKVWNKKLGIGWIVLAVVIVFVPMFIVGVVTDNNIIFALSWLSVSALILLLLGKFVSGLWYGPRKDTKWRITWKIMSRN